LDLLGIRPFGVSDLKKVLLRSCFVSAFLSVHLNTFTEMAEEDDEAVKKQLKGLIEILSTSGKPVLNVEIMKKFKKLCR